jgi:hypothetical protein
MNAYTILQTVSGIITSIILLGIFLILLLKKPDRSKEEFLISFNSLSSVLTSYKTHILDPKIKTLKKDHDLDKSSQTNTIKLFNEAKEKLLAEAAREIFAKYINKRTIQNLDEFYTRDGLILFIITYFRG